jgi:hypothetical protein
MKKKKDGLGARDRAIRSKEAGGTPVQVRFSKGFQCASSIFSYNDSNSMIEKIIATSLYLFQAW